MMYVIHRSKAQFRSTGPTGLRGAPKEQDQGAGCLLESTAKALEVRSIHQEDSDSDRGHWVLQRSKLWKEGARA